MDIKVNANTLTKALNDKKFKTELIEYLNGVVDEELEKGENMDTELIEECTEMLFEMENGYEELNIEREVAKKIIKFCHKNTANKNRYRQIAAVVAVMIISYASLYNASPAFAYMMQRFSDAVKGAVLSIEYDITEETKDVVNIELYPEIEESTVIRNETDIDVSKVRVKIKRLDKGWEEIPISKCRIKRSTIIDEESGKRNLVIAIGYGVAADALIYEMEE